jgi:hypothetical protein
LSVLDAGGAPPGRGSTHAFLLVRRRGAGHKQTAREGKNRKMLICVLEPVETCLDFLLQNRACTNCSVLCATRAQDGPG